MEGLKRLTTTDIHGEFPFVLLAKVGQELTIGGINGGSQAPDDD
jgi:hypothetical protein